jgi:hypothetical protein
MMPTVYWHAAKRRPKQGSIKAETRSAKDEFIEAVDPATYSPLIMRVQLHGIFAMPKPVGKLAKNCLKAARNTLNAHKRKPKAVPKPV